MVQQQNYDIYQDVVTQLPALSGYSHFIRVFEPPSTISQDTIVAELQKAFDELRSKISFLGHRVIVVGAEPENSGFITSAPWPATAPPNNVSRINLESDFPSARTLSRSGGNIVATHDLVPIHCLPERHLLEIQPVILLRAVFIDGGVMVIFTAHHNMIDGMGMVKVEEHLATLMNGGQISEKDIEAANLDRKRVLPLIPPGEPVKDNTWLIRPDPWPLPPPPQCEWRVFMVSPSDLAKVKAAASTPSKTASSDDALTALCWQRITAVRLALGRVSTDEISKFGRAITGRKAMGLDDSYLGHMMMHAATRLPISQVVKSPLSELAARLRSDIDEARTEWSVRSHATFLASYKDKNKIIYGGITNPRTDVGGTSLLPYIYRPYHMGILGQSKLFRMPKGAQIPSCLYFLPSDRQKGELQILLCLPREELDGLGRDEQWSRYIETMGKRVLGSKL